MRLAVVLFAVVSAALPAWHVRACSVAGPQPFEVDPTMSVADVRAPELTGLSVTTIKRGKSSENTGCGSSGSSCDDLGWIGILPAVTDDRTPTAELGYALSLVEGKLPEGLELPSQRFKLPAPGKEIRLSWLDGQTDDQEPFDFVLSVVVIDLAGNETAPMAVHVTNGGNGGCSVAWSRTPRAAGPMFALLALAALARRRKRESQQPIDRLAESRRSDAVPPGVRR
jgi:MYXO-CTERM domain-containing protein